MASCFTKTESLVYNVIVAWKEKVIAYITRGDQLLVFRHTHFPEAGIQVPAGTIEPSEPPHAAALREAEEESGLPGLTLQAYLGVQELDMRPYGVEQHHRRHFFHLAFDGETPERWIHFESHPSDAGAASDSQNAIEFEFYWVTFPDHVPVLAGDQGAMLHRLNRYG